MFHVSRKKVPSVYISFACWLSFQFCTVTALAIEENERNYFPRGKIARVVCAGKEGTRKVITGIDGHTVHGQTLRARRLMEIVPGHGELSLGK